MISEVVARGWHKQRHSAVIIVHLFTMNLLQKRESAGFEVQEWSHQASKWMGAGGIYPTVTKAIEGVSTWAEFPETAIEDELNPSTPYTFAVLDFARKWGPKVGTEEYGKFLEDLRVVCVQAQKNFRLTQVKGGFGDGNGDNFLSHCPTHTIE